MRILLNYGLLTLFIIALLGSCKIGKRSKLKHPQTFKDPRDANIYKLVTIGHQTWFAENLRYKAEGSWVYPDRPSKKYGRLYDWETALVACPKGWHLPTDEEWRQLELALGLDTAITKGWRGTHARVMKSTKGWSHDFLKSENGNNRSNFNVLPAGSYWPDRRGGETYHSLGSTAFFWSASAYDASHAWQRALTAYANGIGRYEINKSHGLSCRCLQDPA